MVAFLLVGMFTLLHLQMLMPPERPYHIGPGLNNPEGMTITQNQLQGLGPVYNYYLEQQDVIYSTINTCLPRAGIEVKGVLLE